MNNQPNGVMSGYHGVYSPATLLTLSLRGGIASDCTFGRGAVNWQTASAGGGNLTILSECTLSLVSGNVSGIVLSSGASLVVSSGRSALAVTSNAGASVTVAEGGYIEYVTTPQPIAEPVYGETGV